MNTNINLANKIFIIFQHEEKVQKIADEAVLVKQTVVNDDCGVICIIDFKSEDYDIRSAWLFKKTDDDIEVVTEQHVITPEVKGFNHILTKNGRLASFINLDEIIEKFN